MHKSFTFHSFEKGTFAMRKMIKSCLSYETQVLYSWEAKPNPTAEQNLKKESHSKRYYYVCSYPVDRWQERMAILL